MCARGLGRRLGGGVRRGDRAWGARLAVGGNWGLPWWCCARGICSWRDVVVSVGLDGEIESVIESVLFMGLEFGNLEALKIGDSLDSLERDAIVT